MSPGDPSDRFEVWIRLLKMKTYIPKAVEYTGNHLVVQRVEFGHRTTRWNIDFKKVRSVGSVPRLSLTFMHLLRMKVVYRDLFLSSQSLNSQI